MKRLKTFLICSSFVIFFTCGITAQSDNETCLSCHEDTELTGLNHLGNEISMFVSLDSLNNSVHAGFACVDCHMDLDGADDYPHGEELAKVDCATCHDDVNDIFMSSAHGSAQADNENAPTCSSCHGSHDILSDSDPAAKTSKKQLPYTCSACHHKQVLTNDPDVKLTDSFDRYMRGIHAEGISKGIGSAASCDDCHGIHDLKPASNIQSKVHKMNIPKTCSKCHNDIFIQYSKGIHGKALAAGILDSPNCSDCHGEHEILGVGDPDSPVNAAHLSDYVCGRCHNDPALAEKYGLGKDRFTSYQDTYHGLAIRGGSVKAASCISCHKAHDILPSTNPASSISLANRTETCQKCHIGANDAFAQSYTHKSAEDQFGGINDIIRLVYIIMIVLVIGGMLVHNLIILGRYLHEKNKAMKAAKSVQRFSGNMVFQHMVVTISFIILVVTGFALKYPNAWWVSILNFFGMFESARSVIHRIAAILLVYISIHHMLYLLFTKSGKKTLRDIFPTWKDLTEIKQNILYHLKLSEKKPEFGFYDYTMKAEYWALVWGTFVMVFTGTVLWFPTFYTSFLPAWIVTVSETIHLYEAWLATLAIAVFHFFFVMFHPEQYPMSFTWLSGKMTVSEMKHHHAGWYKEEFGEKADASDDSSQKEEEHPA
ncbi:MAG: hypothetical protein DWP97_07895 [Calditrichaeota bacterium]|nr:MAG: hypothetical protein DWP97_07895 [Calditrichota bacterium]